jgi:hypothetical protein
MPSVVILISQLKLWLTDVNYSCIVLLFRVMRLGLSGTTMVQYETVNSVWHMLVALMPRINFLKSVRIQIARLKETVMDTIQSSDLSLNPDIYRSNMLRIHHF